MNKTPPQYIPNIFERDTYQPGDGAVATAMRPGSQDHEAVPSKIGNQMRYRDGRVEVVRAPADDTEGGAV